jgi:hypothetical protein
MDHLYFFKLLLVTGLTLVASVLNVPGDGACFFHCIVAHFSRVLHKEINAADLRKYICTRLFENRDLVVPGLGMSPLEFFNTTYGLDAQNREKLVNIYLSVEQRTPCTFEEYVEAMTHPNTYADNLIVAFSSHELKVSMTVFTCSRTSVQKSPTGIENVDSLVAMGFKVESVKAALRNSATVDEALDKLISNPSAVFVEVPTEDVWREEQYGSHNSIHINLINDYEHFQLVTDLKPMDLKPRVRLPEIKCIFDEDSNPLPHLHHEPHYFGNTQRPSRNKFYVTCTDFLKPISPELPKVLNIRYQIEQGADPEFLASLIGSFEFPEFNMVRYRIIAFHFNDGKLVSHTGCIEDLSYGNVKKRFFAQIFEKNSTSAVHSVVLQRC